MCVTTSFLSEPKAFHSNPAPAAPHGPGRDRTAPRAHLPPFDLQRARRFRLFFLFSGPVVNIVREELKIDSCHSFSVWREDNLEGSQLRRPTRLKSSGPFQMFDTGATFPNEMRLKPKVEAPTVT